MRIIEFTAENVKRLRVVSIRPDRSLVPITGANGSGKSSVLDAIHWALAGTKAHESQPIRQGEERATIRLDLGEFTVTRRFTADGTTLRVEAGNGAIFPSPQRMLDKLLGALTFDPLAFSRMSPREQLDTLRGLVPLDVDVDAIDRQVAKAYAERTDVNRRVKSLTERVATLRAGIDPAADVELIDVSELLSKMQLASDHNAAIREDAVAREHRQGQIDVMRRDEAAKRERIRALLEAADGLAKAIATEEAALAALPAPVEPMDLHEIRREIEEAQKTNHAREQQARNRALHGNAVDQLTAEQVTSDNLTQEIDDATAAKHAAIARARMPVEGLGFGEGEVTFNGLPFAQASSAEQLRVSVALAMAANPQLRVLRIKDGSLLDERSLALIADMAEAQDYQIWVERVDTTGKVGIVMEEGAVAAVDGVPTTQPEEVAAD